jgi:hypothetical protein
VLFGVLWTFLYILALSILVCIGRPVFNRIWELCIKLNRTLDDWMKREKLIDDS